MSFSDLKFAYGPFVPHYVPRQYVENYFAAHKTDEYLVLNTTVEDVSKVPSSTPGFEQWKLTLRKYDFARHVDIWWEEVFDAVVLANGHYSVPYVSVPPSSPHSHSNALFPVDSTSQRIRRILEEVSRPRRAFQVLSFTTRLLGQKSPCYRKLGVRPGSYH